MDELRTALQLATDEELQQISSILFTRKFNPIDYLRTPEPIDIDSLSREERIEEIEDRFRYLAADGFTVLQGRTNDVTYREALIRVCRYLKIPYQRSASTMELETEVFLHLMGKAIPRLPQSDRSALTARVQKSLTDSSLDRPLPVHIQHDPLKLLLKGGGVIALGSIVQPLLLRQIARQFAIHFATYQVAQNAIVKGGASAATQIQHYITWQMAKRGMATTATKQSALRGVFAVLGPAMWSWFLVDLGWRTISTNYGRIIPTIVTLAQIRLTRADDLCWEMV